MGGMPEDEAFNFRWVHSIWAAHGEHVVPHTGHGCIIISGSRIVCHSQSICRELRYLIINADLGTMELKAHVFGDASAALGIIARRGLGKVRHLNTAYLWVQVKAAEDDIKYHKVPGQKSIADVFTKALDWCTIQLHTEAIGGSSLRDATNLVIR